MELIGDVWVNWFYNEEKSYNVCQFYEWRNLTDKIESIDEMPLLKISSELFTYIENGLHTIPFDMLKLIENVSKFKPKGKNAKNLKYACVITDGKRVLAIDTDGTHLPRKKSKLVIKQENLIINIVEGSKMEESVFEYTPVHKQENMFKLVPDECMVGLIRRERYLKELLFMIFEQLQDEKDIHRLRYFYSEWNPKGQHSIKELNYDELFLTLFSEVKLGWSNNHHDLLKALLRLDPLYKILYDDEMLIKTN